jgi:hypothetical protein
MRALGWLMTAAATFPAGGAPGAGFWKSARVHAHYTADTGPRAALHAHWHRVTPAWAG